MCNKSQSTETKNFESFSYELNSSICGYVNHFTVAKHYATFGGHVCMESRSSALLQGQLVQLSERDPEWRNRKWPGKQEVSRLCLGKFTTKPKQVLKLWLNIIVKIFTFLFDLIFYLKSQMAAFETERKATEVLIKSHYDQAKRFIN